MSKSAAQAEILVVDDVLTNRLVLQRLLEVQGHRVTTASDGEEALALLIDRQFDLVLLDIMMPVKDGYEVLEALRGRADWHHTPVVVVSAVDELASVVRCLELGASDYLFKPINLTMLRARVEACLDRKRAHDRERAAAQALAEASRLRTELLAVIAHELTNPVTAIKGYADLLLRREADARGLSIAEGLRGISGLAHHLAELIRDLGDLSRIEAGALRLNLEQVDLAAVAATAIDAAQSLMIAKGQALAVEVAPDLPPLWADAVRTAQVLTNLLSNASKYTPRGGQIALRARRADVGAIEIAVSDTGIGIWPEDQPRVFERFFRAGDPAVRAERGAGVGLYISRQLVEAQGGRIWFTSEPRRGSTFYVALPSEAHAPPEM